MKTRTLKILRDLSSRKARTALVSLSIFIGVLGVVTLFSMGDILVRTLESDLQKDKMAMMRTYVSVNSQQEIDNVSILELLNSQAGGAQTIGLALYPVYWKTGDEFEEARLFAYSQSLENLPVEPNKLVDGRYPEPGNREIAVERRFADTHGVSIGDTVTLRILGEMQEEPWTIVGTVFLPYQYPLVPGGPTSIRGDQMIFATYEDAKDIAGFRGFNMFLTRYQDFETARAQAETFESLLAEQTPYIPTTSIVEDPEENPYVLQVRSFRDVMGLLAIVALIVSGFLVFNVVNALVFEQRRQIGVMKSLGADSSDTFLMYSGLSFIYGVIGVIPGVLLGIPLGFYATKVLEKQLNFFLDEFQVSPVAIMMGILMGLLVPLLASILPVMSGIRVTILEAMTDLGIDATYGRGRMARLIDKIPLPVSTRQALRNVVQKRGRLALTMITLSLAAGAFMGVFAMLSSLQTVVEDIFGTFGNQITFSPNETQDFDRIRTLVNLEGIKTLEPAGAIAIEVEGYTPRTFGAGSAVLFALGINPENEEIVHFNLRSGTAWENDPTREGVVLTAGIADAIGKDTGDRVRIRTGATTLEFEIIGVVNYPFDTVWMSWEQLARFGGLTRGAPTPNQYFTTVQIDGRDVAASGINDMAASFLTITDGAFLAPGKVMITQEMADSWNLRVGDTLTLNAGEQSGEYAISGIFRVPSGFESQEAVALFYEDLARLEGLSPEGEPVPNSFSIIMEKDNPTADEVDHLIQEINEVLLSEGITANFTNWVAGADQVSQLVQTSGILMNTAALLIAAVGAIGLFSTLSMSVFERQKEIGVMRSIGATSGAIATQFLIEGWIVGILAWLVGIPLSVFLFDALVTTFNFGDAVGVEYNPLTVIVGLIGMLAIATVSSLWPSIAAARKTVSDILRYQ